jgi:hypothetical protein
MRIHDVDINKIAFRPTRQEMLRSRQRTLANNRSVVDRADATATSVPSARVCDRRRVLSPAASSPPRRDDVAALASEREQHEPGAAAHYDGHE